MKRIKTETLRSLAVCLLLLAVGWFWGRSYGRRVTHQEIARVVSDIAAERSQGKVGRVLSLIESQYVDSISRDSLAELAIPQILESLDPHSVYIPARDFEKTEEPLQGEFDGIGVVFNMATDTVIVLNVIPSGPSQKAGLMAGDRIITVDSVAIAGQQMSTESVMKRLRGKRGTKVRLGIERGGSNSLVEFVVTRDAIPLHSVEASVMLTKDVGFIKLSQFSRTSSAEVNAAITKLRDLGMRKLIFDLRGNSGGFLDQAIRIADEFLGMNDLIVYTEDRHHNQQRQYASGSGKATDLALAVLIDEGSASSSEILAGALQDNDRGVIIGRRSFGKGLVQSQIPFQDGSALRLTVARYYTPTGRSIQKPYQPGDNVDYEMDLINRFNRNEFFSQDSIKFADSLKFTTPKGKIVYGGGGIMPDVFMPLDTTYLSAYYHKVTARNILYRYTIEYSDRHRALLQRVNTISEMKALLDSDKNLFSGFVSYAERHGVERNERQIAISRKLMETQIRAYVSRNTSLESDAFYYFISNVDMPVLKAISVLENNEF